MKSVLGRAAFRGAVVGVTLLLAGMITSVGPLTGTASASPYCPYIAPCVYTGDGSPVNIRTGPGTSYPSIGTYPDGSSIYIRCQSYGEWVYGMWGWTNLWDNNSVNDYAYISDGFVYTGSNSPVYPLC